MVGSQEVTGRLVGDLPQLLGEKSSLTFDGALCVGQALRELCNMPDREHAVSKDSAEARPGLFVPAKGLQHRAIEWTQDNAEGRRCRLCPAALSGG